MMELFGGGIDNLEINEYFFDENEFDKREKVDFVDFTKTKLISTTI